jgi:3-methyladenine DNA glycosylase AlkC
VHSQKLTLETMRAWVEDEDPHVRRLVSEGTRTRLPWSTHLRSFQKDPSKTVSLLEFLRTDQARYVQVSVANNLADMIKDDAGLGLSLAQKWLADNHPVTKKIIHHAVRFPAKRGNALAASMRQNK